MEYTQIDWESLEETCRRIKVLFDELMNALIAWAESPEVQRVVALVEANPDWTWDEKGEARRRSREDVRQKRREMRRRKGR